MEQLRIALTISGAVSLGAYEGGALAALLAAVQATSGDESPPIRIDAIGGASAGAITALLTARTLLAGLDPIFVMEESWVRRPALDSMSTRDAHALLSVDSLRRTAVEFLDPPEQHKHRRLQNNPIKVHMAMACLRGLTYRLARLEGEPIESTTYLDWATFTFTPEMTAEDYVKPPGASPVDFALASGANALGFPPRALNRKVRAEDLEMLARDEIIDLPQDWSGWLWYTDGGTIDNEPLGETLDLANEIDKEDPGGKRLHLLIHPHPTAPPKDDSWANPNRRPPWVTTLARTDRIQRSQSLFEDLRRAEKTNSRLVWLQRVREALEGLLLANPEAAAETLGSVVAKMKGEKAAIRAHQANAIEAEPISTETSRMDAKQLLEEALEFITGLGGKEAVAVDVVSPLILPEAKRLPVEDLLAGEFLGHFGGFLSQRLRMSDFILGYRSMAEWLKRLPEWVTQETAEDALVGARRGWKPDWDRSKMGTQTFRDLPLGERVDLYRVLPHAARVIFGELLKKSRP